MGNQSQSQGMSDNPDLAAQQQANAEAAEKVKEEARKSQERATGQDEETRKAQTEAQARQAGTST